MSDESITQAIEALRRGKPVIVIDNPDREDEGDLVLAAQHATVESLAFMIRHTSGIVCVAMTPERLEELKLNQMVKESTEPRQTAFTVSVDYLPTTSTGISAADRVETIKALCDPNTKPEELCRPGHVFPLRSRPGGVLKRQGHTEASVDLMKLAGLFPAAAIAELVCDDGSVMRGETLKDFAKEHELCIVTIKSLVEHRRKSEKLVECVAKAQLPTDYGVFTAYVFRSELDEFKHLALVRGEITEEPLLVRVHSECLTGDTFRSRRCDCGPQLQSALRMIDEAGSGVVVYLRGHEGRGIGLQHKLRAYSLQDEGHDTVEANIKLGLPPDSRDYGIGAQILADLGVRKMRLMTNNPAKYSGLAGYHLEIVERVPLITGATLENIDYLRTKQIKLGHQLEIDTNEEPNA